MRHDKLSPDFERILKPYEITPKNKDDPLYQHYKGSHRSIWRVSVAIWKDFEMPDPAVILGNPEEHFNMAKASAQIAVINELEQQVIGQLAFQHPGGVSDPYIISPYVPGGHTIINPADKAAARRRDVERELYKMHGIAGGNQQIVCDSVDCTHRIGEDSCRLCRIAIRNGSCIFHARKY